MVVLGPVLFLSAFLVAWQLTGLFRRYALAKKLLDVPNERSSHAVATPRGGGLAIVVTMLALLPILAAVDVVSWHPIVGLMGSGAVVAAVGFADDRYRLSASVRLVGHFAAALWLLAWTGLPTVRVFGLVVEPAWLVEVAAATYLVWLLNLTNFMDGIDGIAGVEVISVGACGAFVCAVAAPDSTEWAIALALVASTLGFLIWNWPPAKIFMGDAGSGFLGLMLGALSLQAGLLAPMLFWSWVILLGTFVVDASVTLLRRLLRGERLHEAHRSHAYQHAALLCKSHLPVVLVVGGLNLGWLFPIALLVALGTLEAGLGLLIAYTPLVGVALWFKAGIPST